MEKPPFYLVFDVESAGLHGEGFGVGYVVINASGHEIENGIAYCPFNQALVSTGDLSWLMENVISVMLSQDAPLDFDSAPRLRDWFWDVWLKWRSVGAVLAADVAWPVEARFLAACVDNDPDERKWQGPYPLIDIAAVRFARGFDPVCAVDRLPAELPAHNPLADARQSARLLLEALQ